MNASEKQERFLDDFFALPLSEQRCMLSAVYSALHFYGNGESERLRDQLVEIVAAKRRSLANTRGAGG